MVASFANLTSALADRYRLLRELGQGGMATVYLAEDLRNGRQVAIKVLRPELAAVLGSERFVEEIQTTANLQHPHILPLFDSGVVAGAGDGHGTPYYVMPYVEGESLRQRLERERQLPIADAVRIAREIASALDFAHRRGVVHRDIKPENILLQDGRAIVADFGIARAMRKAGGERLTGTGISLGTPGYMSPEQASAERELDARSDVYALGALTYELLTGEPPFTGVSAQVVIARLMTEAPRAPSTLRKSVPPAVEHAVLRALEKLPADRWGSAAEFADALGHDDRAVRVFARDAHTSRLTRVAAAAVFLAAGAALALAAARFAERRAPDETRRASRVVIPLGGDVLLAADGMPFDISADGSVIVYAGESRGTRRLYARALDSFAVEPVKGTDDARQPFLSPDGRWIAFFADGKLKKIPREGGEPITLAELDGAPTGGSWGDDGTIVYSLGTVAIYKVAADGGSAARIDVRSTPGDSLPGAGPPAAPVTTVRWPQLLPGGRHALVTTAAGIAVVTLADGSLRHLIRASLSNARYLASGHIAFDEREGRIRLVPFDVGRLAVTGGPSPAFEAFRGAASGAAQFAVARNGTLVYVAGGFDRTLVLVDRNGRETPLEVPARGYRFPSVSPDGRLLAVTIDPRPSAIWVIDLARGAFTRVTSGSHTIKSAWSPDGRRLAFVSAGLQWTTWPGLEAPKPVLAPDATTRNIFPNAWAPDGRLVLNRIIGTNRDVAVVAPGDTAPQSLVATPALEFNGSVSPDGRWLTYNSNTTGAEEVYVRAYPAGGPATVVSTRGGVEPRWSRDGRELYYREGTRIMAVPVRTGATFDVLGAPQFLFDGDFDFSQDANWDVMPDGRFVMVRGDPATHGRLLVVVDWFAELAAARDAR